MSVSESQLSQLDREMDQNHREMVIMSIEDFHAQAQFAQQAHGATQSPQVCTRTQGDMLTGTWHGVKFTYNGLHLRQYHLGCARGHGRLGREKHRQFHSRHERVGHKSTLHSAQW